MVTGPICWSLTDFPPGKNGTRKEIASWVEMSPPKVTMGGGETQPLLHFGRPVYFFIYLRSV